LVFSIFQSLRDLAPRLFPLSGTSPLPVKPLNVGGQNFDRHKTRLPDHVVKEYPAEPPKLDAESPRSLYRYFEKDDKMWDAQLFDMEQVLERLDAVTSLKRSIDLIRLAHRVGLLLGSGLRLVDNYNFRTWQMQQPLQNLWSDFTINRKRTGPDASSIEYGLGNIEMKTWSIDNAAGNLFPAKFIFDTQNCAVRRKKTIVSGAFVFGLIFEEHLRLLIVARQPASVAHIIGVLQKKQIDLIWKLKERAEKNIQGHEAYKFT
jgi:hypothetical protein